MIIELNTEPKIDGGEDRDDGSLDYVNIIFIFYNTENSFNHNLSTISNIIQNVVSLPRL